MSIITISESKCTKCGICVQACPVSIIDQQIGDRFPVIEKMNEDRCIYCGHCESVCPENALVHQLSEKALGARMDGNATINPGELGKYFLKRRSIRNYLSKSVDKAILEQIMDIVRYAPTGTNRQLNQWVIVSDQEIISKLASGTIQWMRAVAMASPEMAGRYNLPLIIQSFEKGNDRICRKAPHIFICSTPASYLLGTKDAVIAASHLELLLPSYGLGSCWAGFLMMAFQNSPDLKHIVGIDDTATIHAALMVGYPKYKYYRTPARNKTDIKWI